MPTLNSQQIGPGGITPAYVAAAASQEFVAGNKTWLHVKNADSASHTVTVVTPGTAFGQAIADLTVAVPATSERMIGPFPADGYQGSDVLAAITWSATTSMTVAVFTI